MWKAPNRPSKEISQTFNDGVVEIFSASDIAAPGYKPVEKLTLKNSLRYEERRLGIQRYYASKQAQAEVERVIRVPRIKGISSQDKARTEDGVLYGIEMVQTAETYPPALDLTLKRIEQEAGR